MPAADSLRKSNFLIAKLRGLPAAPLAAAALFLAALGGMLFCLAPTIYWGDSAELTAAAYGLGVAHAPGYPLYLTVARLFTILPASDFAFRMNLSSAFFAAGALTALCFAVARLTRSLGAGILAAFLMGTMASFLRTGLYAEVYAFHLFLFALFLLAVLGEDDGRRRGLIPWLIVGLGLSHHALMLFVLAAYLVMLASGRDLPRRTAGIAGVALLLLGVGLIFRGHSDAAMYSKWIFMASASAGVLALLHVAFAVWKNAGRSLLDHAAPALFCVVLGASAWMAVPLSAARRPWVNWWDAETLKDFISLVSLRGYASTLPQSRMDFLLRTQWPEIMQGVFILLAVAAIIGFVMLAWRHYRAAILLGLVGLGTFAGTLLIRHGKPDALRVQVFMAVAVFAAVSVTGVWRRRAARRGWFSKIFSGVLAAVLCLFLAGVVLRGAVFSKLASVRHADGAYELGRKLLDSVPGGGVLFAGLQSPAILDYFAVAEPDLAQDRRVAVIPVSFLSFEWRVAQIAAAYPWLKIPIVKFPEERQNIYQAGTDFHLRFADSIIRLNAFEEKSFTDFLLFPAERGFLEIPDGVVYRLVEAGVQEETVARMMQQDRSPTWAPGSAVDPVSATNLASIHNERGGVYLNYGYIFTSRALVARGGQEFRTALRLKPDSPEALSGLGQFEALSGNFDEALRLQEQAVRLDPRNALLLDALATSYFRRQTPDSMQRALATWAQAIIVDPKNPKFYHNLAGAYVAMGQNEAAVAMYLKAIAVEPNYLNAYINLANLYRAMGNCPETLSFLERARDRLPGDLTLRAELASAYGGCGMRRLFAAEIQGMARDFPHNADFYHTIGVLFRDIGDVDNAILFYRETKRLRPNYSLTTLFKGADCTDGPLIAKFVQRLPRDPDARVLEASYAIKCVSKAKALGILSQAMKDFPGDASLRRMADRIRSLNIPDRPAAPRNPGNN